MDKKSFRKHCMEIRNQLVWDECKKEEEIVRRGILNSAFFRDSKNVLCYVSYGTEFDTMDLIKSCIATGKNVYVPKVISDHEMEFYKIRSLDDLIPGAYGILEPDGVSLKYTYMPNEKTILFAPGLGFDKQGHRIGYGKGYYDTFLHKINQERGYDKDSFVTVGLCFDCQIFEEIPHEEHDFTLDSVLNSSYSFE